MSGRIDKQECANLIIEAAKLAQFIYESMEIPTAPDTKPDRRFSLYTKLWQRYKRRVALYNKLFDVSFDVPAWRVARYRQLDIVNFDKKGYSNVEHA